MGLKTWKNATKGRIIKPDVKVAKNYLEEDENKKVSKRGRKVAGNARKETEKELARSIISDENYLEGENTKSLSDEK